jgi:hypothetical protein
VTDITYQDITDHTGGKKGLAAKVFSGSASDYLANIFFSGATN